MITPPPNTRYSIANIHHEQYLVEFYREAGSRWYSIAYKVCEGEQECEEWLRNQFQRALLECSQSSPSLDVT